MTLGAAGTLSLLATTLAMASATSNSSRTAPKLERYQHAVDKKCCAFYIPVTADLGEEVQLQQLKVASVEAEDAVVVDDHIPSPDWCDFSALNTGQLRAGREQFHESRLAHVWHLVRVWLARLVHDV